jgi:hypothetical protein
MMEALCSSVYTTRSAKFVHSEFEIEEGWFPFRILSSHLVEVEKQFVDLGTMAKWMEIGWWCQLCFDPLGPEGAFQLGSCGHTFHIGCIQQSAVHCMRCPQCQVPLPRRFYELFGLQAEMPIGYEFNEWNFPLDQGPHYFINFTQ